MQGYEADKLKNQHNGKIKKKDAHAPLRLIQVEIAGAEGRWGGEQRLRETVFRTHLVWAQTMPAEAQCTSIKTCSMNEALATSLFSPTWVAEKWPLGPLMLLSRKWCDRCAFLALSSPSTAVRMVPGTPRRPREAVCSGPLTWSLQANLREGL